MDDLRFDCEEAVMQPKGIGDGATIDLYADDVFIIEPEDDDIFSEWRQFTGFSIARRVGGEESVRNPNREQVYLFYHSDEQETLIGQYCVEQILEFAEMVLRTLERRDDGRVYWKETPAELPFERMIDY
jgi:hypothetical protein